MNTESLEQRLQRLLFETKRTHADVAKAAGISKNSITRCMHGTYSPTLKVAEKMITYLEAAAIVDRAEETKRSRGAPRKAPAHIQQGAGAA